MKLILIRHGETEEEKKGMILGRLPGTLSKEGKEQAKDAALFIKATGLLPEAIITSDLARALDFAAIIGHELKLEIELEPLARERNAGIAEGKSESEIDWKEYEKEAKLLRKHAGGENFEEVRARAKEFLEKLKNRPFGVAVLVSHSVFLAMLMVEVCGWPLDKALDTDYRKPWVVEIEGNKME